MTSNFSGESPTGFVGTMPFTQLGRAKWILVVAALILSFVILSILRSIFTDFLWFTELGFRDVFYKIIITRVVLFSVGFAIFAVLGGFCAFFAHKATQGPEQISLPPHIRNVIKKFILWGTVAGIGFLSLIFGLVASGQWEVFLKFGSSTSFDILDPVYGKDVSFYVFTMPFYEFLQGWTLSAAIVILIATLAIYFVNFSFRGVGLLITQGIRLQMSIIGAIIIMIIGAGLWLDRWALVLSDNGTVFGAAYTDVHARKNALLILALISIASAVLMLLNSYIRGVRLAIGAVGLFVVMGLILIVLWPNAMQRITVGPNEFTKEELYIQRNIHFTRNAFALDSIVDQPYPVDPTLTAEMVAQNRQTVDNIRLWDQRPLSSVYRFEQVIRPYYSFAEADVDRYMVDGEYRQVMVAAREVALDNLAIESPDSQTWINEKLRYTHGFGIAMSPVTEFTAKGRPEYFAQDIPQDGIIAIQATPSSKDSSNLITNPRIYYGEETTDYVIVNSNTKELDYQAANEGSPRSISYSDLNGLGGVPVGSFIRRAAYAWQFADINIMITGEINPKSRIQYRREVQERISAVAPFLLLDEDPYIVAAEGGLFWIQDAYTFTDRFPYSDPLPEGFNYVRNSVKVVVDAFHGTMTFYVWDLGDPLVATYMKMFPSLLVSKEQMPESLSSHVRYPQDLFSFQASKYLRYHMTEPQDFYNLEDIWSIPREKFGQSGELQPVLPYYVIMKMPGEDREEYVLLLPYTRNEPNPIMAGWLAARNDGDLYGELIALNFPKDRRVKGPEQIEADIDTDEMISEWTTLRCDENLGSFCIRGNLLVVPVATEDRFGLLYAEPIYLQAENVEFPALKKVVLATDAKVVMEDSIPEALAALTGIDLIGDRMGQEGEGVSLEQPLRQDSSAGLVIERLKKQVEALKSGISDLERDLVDLLETIGGQD